MVSVHLPSDALSEHLPSYLGFSYLGRGVFLHSCSSKAQPLLLTLDEEYLPMVAPPDPECEVAPLGPRSRLLGLGVGAASTVNSLMIQPSDYQNVICSICFRII